MNSVMINEKVVAEHVIYETKNYNLFKSLDGQPKQRAAKNAVKLKDEIFKSGGNILPIIVTVDYKVIDGNTRLEACRLLGVPVKFQVIDSNDIYSLELMRMMNASSRPWSIPNFIEFYGEAYGKVEYQILAAFILEVKLSIGILQEFDSSINQKVIKNGTLKTVDYNLLRMKVNIMNRVHTAVGLDRMSSKLHLARAVNRLIVFQKQQGNDPFNPHFWGRLVSKTERNIQQEMKKSFMNKIDSSGSLLPLLQKCYNYGVAQPSREYIFKEEL